MQVENQTDKLRSSLQVPTRKYNFVCLRLSFSYAESQCGLLSLASVYSMLWQTVKNFLDWYMVHKGIRCMQLRTNLCTSCLILFYQSFSLTMFSVTNSILCSAEPSWIGIDMGSLSSWALSGVHAVLSTVHIYFSFQTAATGYSKLTSTAFFRIDLFCRLDLR